MRIRILGEAIVELTSGEVTPSAPHLFALLLRLGAEPSRHHQRSEIARALYAECGDGSAALHSVRQLIYKAAAKGAPIVKHSGSISLARPPKSDLDELVAADPSLVGLRQRNLAILAGYAPPFSSEFADWVELFRGECQTRLRHSLVLAIATLRKRANWAAVEIRARECLTIDPYNEPATLALAEALARTGSKERAISVLNAYGADVGDIDASIAVPAILLRKRIDSGREYALDGAKTPLIGRGDEFAVATREWDASHTAGPSCVQLIGDHGSGKSRFAGEFLEAVHLSGKSRIAHIRGSSLEPGRPYGLLAELIPYLLQLPGAAGCDPGLLPFLNRLIDAHSDTPDGFQSAEQSQLLSVGIARAWHDLIDAICSERACVICIDDSRAIDDTSLALIKDVLRSTKRHRLFVLIVRSDDDIRDTLSSLPHFALKLHPLGEADATALLESLFRSVEHSQDPSALAWCLALGGGNPSLLTLAAAHATSGMDLQLMPPNMVSAIDNRLNKMPAALRRTIEACVVLGDHCDVLLLSRTLDLSTIALASALHELEHAGLVFVDGATVGVRSRLLRDRVTALSSKSVLMLLHARCAALLSRQSTEFTSSWIVASHWLAAGKTQQARSALTASWRSSLRLGKPEVAEKHIREFLALAHGASEKVALLENLIEVTQASGSYGATIEAIDTRASLIRAHGLDDPRSEALRADRIDCLLLDYADPTAAEGELKALMASAALDQPRRMRAALRLLVTADARAEQALADEVFNAIRDIQTLEGKAQVFRDQALLIFHSVFGSKAEALRLARVLADYATRFPESWPHVRASVNASLALQLAGESSEAMTHLQETYKRLVSAGVTSTTLLVAARLASFFLDDGDVEKAYSWARASELHRPNDDTTALPSDYLSVKADLAMLAGRYEEARTYVDRMRHASPMYLAPRFKMEALSYSLRLGQFEGSKMPIEDLTRLLDWHHQARCFGRHDDDMDVIWVGLNSVGQEELASRLLAEYVTRFRRETMSCRYMLRLRTATDPIWQTFSVA